MESCYGQSTHILEIGGQSETRVFTRLDLTQLISSSCSHADRNRVPEPAVASFQLCPCNRSLDALVFL